MRHQRETLKGARMSTTQFRLATAQDLPGLLALYQELRPHDPPLSDIRAAQQLQLILQNPLQHIVVADTNQQLTATAMLVLAHNLAYAGRPFGVIEHVVTAHAFRGQGLAKSVLQHCLDLAWAADCAKVMLLSGAARPQAHALYQSLGFCGDTERGFVIKAEDLRAQVQNSQK
jgi:ribosomal protein S18 acetylase RimI-like enzyme